MDIVFFVFEIIGTVAFALSGALTAMKKEMDIFGACVLGMTTVIGGGIIRDLVLGITPPTSFINPTHALIGIAVSAFTYFPFMQKFFTLNKHKSYEFFMLVADSVGLGAFTVIGVNTGFEFIEDPNLFTTVFLGVITGVGGGVMRDVMAHNVPKIFVKQFYACASISGALVCFLVRKYFDPLAASVIGMALIVVLRFLAAKFRWKLPKPKYCMKNLE